MSIVETGSLTILTEELVRPTTCNRKSVRVSRTIHATETANAFKIVPHRNLECEWPMECGALHSSKRRWTSAFQSLREVPLPAPSGATTAKFSDALLCCPSAARQNETKTMKPSCTDRPVSDVKTIIVLSVSCKRSRVSKIMPTSRWNVHACRCTHE